MRGNAPQGRRTGGVETAEMGRMSYRCLDALPEELRHYLVYEAPLPYSPCEMYLLLRDHGWTARDLLAFARKQSTQQYVMDYGCLPTGAPLRY